ncbi:amidohydrolase family protein [Bradyrhizobium ontarionense]|uniref:Amidohydrolase family protein n=1 Tax=Bradyrhizobium ontarionense TaxID=2898149 RepID=A0ABY3RN20_9BRAD|nr:amidohydrolase family protein [Bradyrhizobium sp. A19]UFZ07949.1 amidohydrolase family protein [Bradyrhizobium sp. A19]
MPHYDLIIRGGRVLDPETQLDAAADVAIKDGAIAAVGDVAGAADHIVDAAGLAVVPGFIDLHAHGQSLPADRMQAFDGVTTTLELEVGVLPVARWYDEQAAIGRTLNYGAATGWAFARIATMTMQQTTSNISGMGEAMRDKRWVEEVATAAETAEIVARVRQGLEQGGLGIAFPNAYAPGTGLKELSELCSLAAKHDVPTYTHIAYMSNVDPRSSVDAYTRLIGLAGSTGAHMHICHFNSTSLQDVERCAELVQTAQAQGLKVTVEAYPYGTGSTVVGAGFFADPAFCQRMGTGYDAIEMVAERHRLGSRDELLERQERDPGALVLIHFLDVAVDQRHRELLDVSVLYPGGAIASDAMPWILTNGAQYTGDAWPLPDDAVSHPRSSATFTKFLREWVLDRKTVPLMDGIAKCTLIPARILEPSTPAMRRKGRLQAGCDADIAVLDLASLHDRADFLNMNRPSEGVRHLLVNGRAVIADGNLVRDIRPGQAVRRPVLS